MTSTDFALLLAIVGVFGLFVQSFVPLVGPVAPGWFGAGLVVLAALLTGFPG